MFPTKCLDTNPPDGVKEIEFFNKLNALASVSLSMYNSYLKKNQNTVCASDP